MHTDDQARWAAELARDKRTGGAAQSSQGRPLLNIRRDLNQQKVMLQDALAVHNLAAAKAIFTTLVSLRKDLLVKEIRDVRAVSGTLSSTQFTDALYRYHADCQALAKMLDEAFNIAA